MTCSRPHYGGSYSVWGNLWPIRPILAALCFSMTYVIQYYMLTAIVHNIVAPNKILVDTQLGQVTGLRYFLYHHSEQDAKAVAQREEFLKSGTVEDHIYQKGPPDTNATGARAFLPPLNILDKHWSQAADPRTAMCNVAMFNQFVLFIIQLIWLFVSYLNLEPAVGLLKWVVLCPRYYTVEQGGASDYECIGVDVSAGRGTGRETVRIK